MKLFGFEISRSKAATVPAGVTPTWPSSLMYGYGTGGWFNVVREAFTGAWQRNYELRYQTVLAFHAVYACIKLISGDISKCRLRLVEQDSNGIWREVARNSPYWAVLRRPNRYQDCIKFVEYWIICKLVHGNVFVLKARDERGIVVAMYILDPTRCRPEVAPDGSVYYRLYIDKLAGLEETDPIVVPQSEIIHDRMMPLYHPLCGISPLSASGVAAAQGLTIQNTSTEFFANGTRPGGILTAPGLISEANAQRVKEHWENNYGGNNFGKVAVLGDGLKYEQMFVNAVDAQLIEQLKWTAEVVCSTFNVPPYKIGVGPMPAHNNVEALNQQYYDQCLQVLFESVELCLDFGLGLTEVPDRIYGTEFDLDGLLRMDTATMVEAESKAVQAGIKAPNEARFRMNLPPVKGGATPYLQQQNYSLAALDERDRGDDPFNKNKTPIAPIEQPAAPEDDVEEPADDSVDEKIWPVIAATKLSRQLGLIDW